MRYASHFRPRGLPDNFCSHICLVIIIEKTIVTFTWQGCEPDTSMVTTGPYNEAG